MSDAERRLWYYLRAQRFGGHEFKRQVPIGAYVVDFACLNRKLIDGIDGGQHAGNAGDKQRHAWLKTRGFEVMRFWNNEVLKNTNGILELIVKALDGRPSPGALRAPPSPQGGEGNSRRQTH